MKMFDNLVLYKFNQECIKILKNKKILSNFKKIKKIFLYPESKKNIKIKNKFKKIFYLKKCGHFIFLDRPKKTFSLIKKYA
jgi:phage pi2 protein 07